MKAVPSGRPKARALAFGAALVAFVFAPQWVALANSRLLPLRSRIDLGTVRPGAHIRRQFALANLSLRPVRVLSVSGGCGCVATVPGPNRIAPLTIKTIRTAFAVRETAGPLHRQIVVEVDDPRRPYLALELWGTVAPPPGASRDSEPGPARRIPAAPLAVSTRG